MYPTWSSVKSQRIAIVRQPNEAPRQQNSTDGRKVRAWIFAQKYNSGFGKGSQCLKKIKYGNNF